MSDLRQRLADNLQRVRDRIAAACSRSQRRPDDVRLIAVTKYAPIEAVRELAALGFHDFGESRPQQLVERAAQLPPTIRWHLIGHLQRNKARKVLPFAAMIHSIDSLRLLTTLDELAGELNLRPRVLLEVNISGEAAKDGFAPDELLQSADVISSLEQVEIAGLMTMAPLDSEPEGSRPTFAGLRTFRDRLASMRPQTLPLRELSMGMSGDFEIAIEEGATMIRLGSTLFEGIDA